MANFSFDASSVTVDENTGLQVWGDQLGFDYLSPEVAGVTLRISGLLTGERLALLPTVNLTVEGGVIRYKGAMIGLVVGGDGEDLTITFSGTATNVTMQEVLGRLAFSTTSDAPAPTRELSFSFTGADGELVGNIRTPSFTEMVEGDNPFDHANVVTEGGRVDLTFFDFDGDGDRDLFAFGGSLFDADLYRRETNGTYHPRNDADNPATVTAYGADFADLNGDGLEDLLIAKGGSTEVIYNHGMAGTPDFSGGSSQLISTIDAMYHVQAADLNNDGRLDLLLTSAHGVFAAINEGTASVPSFGATESLVNHWFEQPSAQLGDIDGDGDLDLVVYEEVFSETGINYFRNVGTAEAPQFVLATNPFGDLDLDIGSTIALEDVDKDGDLDLVAATSTGSVRYFRNTGSAETPMQVTLNVTGVNDAPTLTLGGGATYAKPVNENGTAGAIFTASDPDSMALTWSLSGEDAARFKISSTGVVSFRNAPDFEAPTDVGKNNVYSIVVTVSDGAGGTDSQQVFFSVKNVAGNTIAGTSGNNAIDATHKISGKGATSEEDKIDGKAGNDTISAGSGNDTLIGGTGKDVLTGGAGADKFVFNTKLNASSNVDTIKDFVHDTDLIQLDDAVFKKIGSKLDAGEFYAKAGATSAHDASDRIIYNKSNGRLYFDDDGKGGHAAVWFATLSTKPQTLDHGDFGIV